MQNGELQELVPFSQCDLWNRQKEFYREEGINAWLDQIPFYVTSNPSIANCYAQIIVRFMQDRVRQDPSAAERPFYIIELGTGSGKFSYYAIKRIRELLNSLQLNNIPFVYVMTDFTESNLNFWKEHPQLEPYLQEGILDYALFDVGNQETIECRNTGAVLRPGEETNPLIVIANYIFDSVPHDIITVNQGSLNLGTIKKTPVIPETSDMNDTITLDPEATGFIYQKIDTDYYDDPAINSILKRYRKELNNGSAWLPVGAFACLKNLQTIANNQLLLLCSDKGSHKSFGYEKNYLPSITFHKSCFSISVNFNALEHFVSELGGDSFHQSYHSHLITLNTSVFLLGDSFSRLPETKTAANEFLNVFSFIDLYVFFKHIETTQDACSLDTLFSLLKMTRWDTEIYQRMLNVILRIKDMKPWPIETIKEIRDAMPLLTENVYYLPENDDPLTALGIFFQEGRDFRQAINYFRESIALYGKRDNVLFYMGLSYYYLGDMGNALKMFKEAVEIKPDNIMARGWVSQLQYQMEYNKKK